MGSRQAALTNQALEESRVTLLDMRQAIREQQLELQLLEEKLCSGESNTDAQLAARIVRLEDKQATILTDIRALGTHANETTQSLIQYRKTIQSLDQRLGEVVKLKSTLNSISKSLGSSGKIHKVSSGDSLDKIARKYNTSIQTLKQANGLHSNTIIIGQELKIP